MTIVTSDKLCQPIYLDNSQIILPLPQILLLQSAVNAVLKSVINKLIHKSVAATCPGDTARDTEPRVEANMQN